MRILFVIPAMQSVKAFFIPLLTELIKRGDEVILCTNVNYESGNFNWDIQLPTELVIHDIEIPRSPIPHKILETRKKIIKIVGNLKTVIHGHFLVGTLIVSSLPQSKNLIILNSLHGLVEKDFTFLKRNLIQILEKFVALRSKCLWLLNRTDYIRLKSFNSAKLLPGYGMGVEELRFSDLSYYKEQSDEIKAEIGIPSDSLTFVYSGRLIQTKGVSELVEGFRRARVKFPNVYLILVGEADPAHKIINIDEEGIVRVGWQTNVQKYFAISDVYVTASYREGFSIGVMESLYCGLPVLCPPTKGLAELIEHQKNGFVIRSNHSEEICKGIEFFVENENLIHEMSMNSKADRSKYLRLNSVKIQINEYDELMKD